MNYPMDATHEAPISATIRDCLVAAWVTPGESTPSAHVWRIDVGGHEYPGPAVDADKHNSFSAVKDMLKAWAAQHPDLFA